MFNLSKYFYFYFLYYNLLIFFNIFQESYFIPPSGIMHTHTLIKPWINYGMTKMRLISFILFFIINILV